MVNNGRKKILIVAGEASGDLHGANLVRALQGRNPDLAFFGVGSRNLRAAGVEILADSSEITAMGITEALAKLRQGRRVFRKILDRAEASPPDLAVLIDSPGFNLRLAGSLKTRGIRVMYYIAPQVWAWGQGRIKKISERIDRLVSILPFEKEFFSQFGIPVDFVGHPLLDLARESRSPEESRLVFGIKPGEKVIALLPGSRPGEIARLLPEILGAARNLSRQRPGLRFLLPVASSLNPQAIVESVQARGLGDAVSVLPGEEIYNALGIAELALVASGTATLEAALIGCPMIILYRVSRLSYGVGRMLVKVKHIGLVNLMAGREVVPELLQGEARAERITREVERFLDNQELKNQVKSDLVRIRASLGNPGAAGRAAQIALEMLETRS
ncbi:MAG: lipid-A-disaccharide synthase [Proteobacteria bacterium]|nr:lipid-A-disaccharide synthase [Pseudomonadota bacterium]